MIKKDSIGISSPKEKYFLVETVKNSPQQKSKFKLTSNNIINQIENPLEDSNNIEIKECSYKLNEKDYNEILNIQIESINNLSYIINNIFSNLITDNKPDKYTQILFLLFSLRLKLQKFFSILHKCKLPKIFERNKINDLLQIQEKLTYIMNITKNDFSPNIKNVLDNISSFCKLFIN